ncbi:hypothetical protein VWZ40_00905 [Phaeobacter sp. JH20_21]|uniref:hypothetical protein n=2 Tax=Phaeobacter TaxID=302485 RepID=UPI003A89DAE2
MTDLIKAADALAEEERMERIARTICAEKNAVYGEPPCWKVDGPWPNPDCGDCTCHDLAKAVLSDLNAYRQARENADGVKVKPLVWECEGGWRWKGTPPDGFFASVAKWVWQAPKGGFKHAGTKELFATLEEAKAAAQADYEARIKAALEG